MTITVKVYLNEAHGFGRSFNPFRAELRLAASFTVEGSEPAFVFDSEAHRDLSNEEFDAVYRAARDEHATWVNPILNRVYEQLNVGGDIFPAEAYTVSYRMLGNRSLSVGDVIALEWDRTLENVRNKDGSEIVVREVEAFAVEPVGFKRTSGLAIRKGLENFAKNEGSLDHFIPVPRTDLSVNEAGMFVVAEPRRDSYAFEFVQEDLRNGL
jgi:hypothetical protein